jgi:hypothetical protein
MRAAALLVVLCACPTTRSTPEMKELPASLFREILQCGEPARIHDTTCLPLHEDRHAIESVRVIPDGKGAARYVITMKTSSVRTLVRAEYPGKILDEMTTAGVMYDVRPD